MLKPKKKYYISIFIYDLAVNIKKTNIWIPINDGKVSLLFHSDDTVKLTENENIIQVSLHLFHNWCWSEKSNVLYFCKDRSGANQVKWTSFCKIVSISFLFKAQLFPHIYCYYLKDFHGVILSCGIITRVL